MNRVIKTILITAILFGGVSVASAQISVGIRIGPPPPPRVVRVLPPRPAPEFVWIDGYWYPVGNHYKWHSGYWTRPPYAGARWVAARHDGRMFYEGYWAGEHGRVEHDHRWDRDRDRDFHEHDRYRDNDRGHDRDDHGRH